MSGDAGPRPQSARSSATPESRTSRGQSVSSAGGRVDTMSVEEMAGFLVEAFGKCRKVRQPGVRPGASARKNTTHSDASTDGRAGVSHGAAGDGKGRAAKRRSHVTGCAFLREVRREQSAAGLRDKDATTDHILDATDVVEEIDIFKLSDNGRQREALSPVVPPPTAPPGVGSEEEETGGRAYPPPTHLFNSKVRAPACSPALARTLDPGHPVWIFLNRSQYAEAKGPPRVATISPPPSARGGGACISSRRWRIQRQAAGEDVAARGGGCHKEGSAGRAPSRCRGQVAPQGTRPHKRA